MHHHKINHTLPGEKSQPNPPYPATLKKEAGEMSSLQTFCSLGLVSWPFHSGEGALPSWGLGAFSVAAPWPRHRAGHQHWCLGHKRLQVPPGRSCWEVSAKPAFPGSANTPRASTKTGQGCPELPHLLHPILWWNCSRGDVTPSEQLKTRGTEGLMSQLPCSTITL